MSGVARWLPGDGWAIVTAGLVIWLPPGTDRALLDDLFALGREDRFVDVANRLATGDGSSVMLLLDPQPRLQNRGGLPARAWDSTGVEVTADGVAAAVGAQLGPGDGPGLPVVEGVVACGGIRWGTSVAEHPPQEPVESGPVAGGPVVPASLPADFIAEVPGWVAAANPFAELWGHTMRRPVEAAAVRVVRDSDSDVEPVPEPAVNVQDPEPIETDASSGASGPRIDPMQARPAPAAPVSSPPPRRSINTVTTTLIADLDDLDDLGSEPDHGEVVGSDGRRLPILGTVVVGRAPKPLPAEECQLFRVASPDRSISRSHTAIGVIDGVVHAKDLGSNNGTTLVRMGRREPLPTDRWTRLESGDALDLGEGTTVRLEGLA